MVNPLEEDARPRPERRVLLGIKVAPAAKIAIETAAGQAGQTVSTFGRQLLAIGWRHYQRGER